MHACDNITLCVNVYIHTYIQHTYHEIYGKILWNTITNRHLSVESFTLMRKIIDATGQVLETIKQTGLFLLNENENTFLLIDNHNCDQFVYISNTHRHTDTHTYTHTHLIKGVHTAVEGGIFIFTNFHSFIQLSDLGS
jgi:hypothetical protein